MVLVTGDQRFSGRGRRVRALAAAWSGDIAAAYGRGEAAFVVPGNLATQRPVDKVSPAKWMSARLRTGTRPPSGARRTPQTAPCSLRAASGRTTFLPNASPLRNHGRDGEGAPALLRRLFLAAEGRVRPRVCNDDVSRRTQRPSGRPGRLPGKRQSLADAFPKQTTERAEGAEPPPLRGWWLPATRRGTVPDAQPRARPNLLRLSSTRGQTSGSRVGRDCPRRRGAASNGEAAPWAGTSRRYRASFGEVVKEV